MLGKEATTSLVLEVNAINKSALTALDLLPIFPSEAGDREIVEILRGAGAIKARDRDRHNILRPASSFDLVTTSKLATKSFSDLSGATKEFGGVLPSLRRAEILPAMLVMYY